MSSRSSVLLLVAIALAGCNNAHAGSAGPTAPPSPPPSSPAPVARPQFDGQQAFKLLQQQCDFGPRPVGSPAHQKTRDFLLGEMRKYADKTVAQDFSYNNLPLTNIIGVFNPAARRSVLLCGHWDTRPTADQEIDPEKKRQPILGASDGASETAVLLELAKMFHQQKPAVGVVIVLLDGEDYGNFETDQGVFLGSRYFAQHHEGYHPEYGILLDMVGDENLDIYKEKNSQDFAPDVNDRLFRIAQQLGYGRYLIGEVKYNISDDHVPLSTIGHIPTIDLIDFDYGPWHTLEDTPDKCSPKSLAVVGNTVAEMVYREKAR